MRFQLSDPPRDDEAARVFRPSRLQLALRDATAYVLKCAVLVPSLALAYVAAASGPNRFGSSAVLHSPTLQADLKAWGVNPADYPEDSFVGSFIVQSLATRESWQSGYVRQGYLGDSWRVPASIQEVLTRPARGHQVTLHSACADGQRTMVLFAHKAADGVSAQELADHRTQAPTRSTDPTFVAEDFLMHGRGAEASSQTWHSHSPWTLLWNVPELRTLAEHEGAPAAKALTRREDLVRVFPQLDGPDCEALARRPSTLTVAQALSRFEPFAPLSAWLADPTTEPGDKVLGEQVVLNLPGLPDARAWRVTEDTEYHARTLELVLPLASAPTATAASADWTAAGAVLASLRQLLEREAPLSQLTHQRTDLRAPTDRMQWSLADGELVLTRELTRAGGAQLTMKWTARDDQASQKLAAATAAGQAAGPAAGAPTSAPASAASSASATSARH